MTRQWKHGDVAAVRCSDGNLRLALYRSSLYTPGLSPVGSTWNFVDGTYRRADESEARPLVVLDPEDAEAVERLRAALGADHYYGDGDLLAAHLREFADPKPKNPPEPKGLCSIVEDEDKVLWVRWSSGGENSKCWARRSSEGDPRDLTIARYSDIRVARVDGAS